MLPTAPYDVLDRYSSLAAEGIAAGVRHRWERMTLNYFAKSCPDDLFHDPFMVPGHPYPLARWQLQRLLDWAVIEPVGEVRSPSGGARRFRLTRLGVAVAGAFEARASSSNRLAA